MRFKKRPFTGARVEREKVFLNLLMSTTDVLHMTLLDNKLTQMANEEDSELPKLGKNVSLRKIRKNSQH